MSKTIPVAISDIHAEASMLADVPTAGSAKPHPGLHRSGTVPCVRRAFAEGDAPEQWAHYTSSLFSLISDPDRVPAALTERQGERLPQRLDAVRQDNLPSLHTLPQASTVTVTATPSSPASPCPGTPASSKDTSTGSRCSNRIDRSGVGQVLAQKERGLGAVYGIPP
ncbi:hypothetical protein [Streptomyces sp. NPDC058305]|uniref:hypothetical protein n=1 Tax=Streptomyces sp. NPDC058305 TaxID=3346438 RepID=UPI0036E79C65